MDEVDRIRVGKFRQMRKGIRGSEGSRKRRAKPVGWREGKSHTMKA